MQNLIKLGISIGDPNGIGPEIILKTLTEEDDSNGIIPIIYSDLDIIEFYLNHLGIKADVNIIDDPMKAKYGILNIFQLSNSNFKIDLSFKKPKSQLDYVKDAAKDNLDRAKKEYSDALKLVATRGRPKPTITKDPSFATQDPKDYLPKRYNPDTGNMDIV